MDALIHYLGIQEYSALSVRFDYWFAIPNMATEHQ